jgi:predicted transcriptional regulator
MQLAFMRALWNRGEASVADVQAALAEQGQVLATTTVATVLRRLEAAKYVTHRSVGRQFVYRARVSQEALGGRALERLRAHVYGGNVGAMLSQLLGSLEVSEDELAQMQRLIDAKTQQREEP